MSQKDKAKMDKAGQEAADKWRKMAESEGSLMDEVETPVGAIDELSKENLTKITNELEQEIERYKNEALRSKAELENVRRRLERDVSNAHKYGSERLIIDMLPVIDSLVRGLELASIDDEKMASIREGMEMTLDILHNTLKKHGVTEIAPEKGDAFDPSLHEAMSMQKVPDTKPNTVIQVLQRGYTLNGRVVRAAMVMVSS